MTERERIANQFERAINGDAWHGPCLKELTDGLSAATAYAWPICGSHSIAEIILHIIAWTNAVRRRLQGDPARLTPEQDWPDTGPSTNENWEAAKEGLAHTHADLLANLRLIADERLDEPILPGMSSIYVTLHGLVQHHLYHAGQIALLKRASIR